jgi:hypothetical protein
MDVSRGADPNGAGVRVLTSAFAPARNGDIFWNSREVPLGGWIFTNVLNLDGVRNDAVVIRNRPLPRAAASTMRITSRFRFRFRE